MEEIKKIVSDTFYEVAIKLAQGNSTSCIEILEQTILLLELYIDNMICEGKPVDELIALKDKVTTLQMEVHNATSQIY